MSRFLSAKRNPTSSYAHVSSTLSVIVRQKNNPEPQDRYVSGGYHQVLPGEVYNQRYQVIRKLGWGIYSTVWLVQDSQFVPYPWTDFDHRLISHLETKAWLPWRFWLEIWQLQIKRGAGTSSASWRSLGKKVLSHGAIITYVSYLTILLTKVQMGTTFVSCWRRWVSVFSTYIVPFLAPCLYRCSNACLNMFCVLFNIFTSAVLFIPVIPSCTVTGLLFSKDFLRHQRW